MIKSYSNIHFDTDTGEVYHNILKSGSTPWKPAFTGLSTITITVFYKPDDFYKEPVPYVKNNRITNTAFNRLTSGKYMLLAKNYVPSKFINDYYSYQFDKLGIKNYSFCSFGDISFNNADDESQFRFYFGDIIK